MAHEFSRTSRAPIARKGGGGVQPATSAAQTSFPIYPLSLTLHDLGIPPNRCGNSPHRPWRFTMIAASVNPCANTAPLSKAQASRKIKASNFYGHSFHTSRMGLRHTPTGFSQAWKTRVRRHLSGRERQLVVKLIPPGLGARPTALRPSNSTIPSSMRQSLDETGRPKSQLGSTTSFPTEWQARRRPAGKDGTATELWKQKADGRREMVQ